MTQAHTPGPMLPCPFCGGEPELSELGDADSYFVHCKDCEVQQIANYRPHVAVRRWNERKPQGPDLLAALRECQSVLATLTAPSRDCTFHITALWARCVEAEASARAAITKAAGESP